MPPQEGCPRGLSSLGFPLAAEFPFSLPLVLVTFASNHGFRVLTLTLAFSFYGSSINIHCLPLSLPPPSQYSQPVSLPSTYKPQ